MHYHTSADGRSSTQFAAITVGDSLEVHLIERQHCLTGKHSDLECFTP